MFVLFVEVILRSTLLEELVDVFVFEFELLFVGIGIVVEETVGVFKVPL